MMAWAFFILVSSVVIWLRFGQALSDRLVSFGAVILLDVLEAHGTKKLVNGHPAQQRRPEAMNRAARRARRAQMLKGK